MKRKPFREMDGFFGLALAKEFREKLRILFWVPFCHFGASHTSSPEADANCNAGRSTGHVSFLQVLHSTLHLPTAHIIGLTDFLPLSFALWKLSSQEVFRPP